MRRDDMINHIKLGAPDIFKMFEYLWYAKD